jgi:adenylate cyclase
MQDMQNITGSPESSLQRTPNTSKSPSSTRRWAVIVMIDVVGFTSLTDRDMNRTLRRWHAWLNTCIEPSVERHHGRVFRRYGDGMLVEFRAADEALACVIEVQRQFAAKAHEVPPFRLRSAIHAGEIETWNDDLHGQAVNIAARLQDLAAPGGILVSATIEELVRGKLEEHIDDIGEVALKGIERPVHAYSLLARPSLSFSFGSRVAAPPSVAVLPFAQAGSQHDTYFGDGIVENIVNALSAQRELRVVSRTSTVKLGGRTNLRDVGRQLGVRYVLSGTVHRADKRIRITARLTATEDLAVLWADNIDDAPMDHIFDFQDRAARQIVGVIAPHMFEAEIRRAARKQPENLDAYDWFLRGLDLVYRLKPDEFKKAKPMFENAIKLDPRYAAPYAYSALWHAVRLGQGWSEDEAGDREAVKYFAEAAVYLDRLDATSLALCGHVQSIQFRNFDLALELFDRAISASPNSAIAWTRSSATYSYLGNWEEAFRRAELGRSLSPMDRHLFYTYTMLALAAYTGGQYDVAVKHGLKAEAANPDFTANLRLLCAALSAEGSMVEARRVADKLLIVQPAFQVERFCAKYAYKEAERREQLAAHLRMAGLPG